MTDNPYESPSIPSHDPAYDSEDMKSSGPKPRPLGISILAVLHLLGGVLLVGAGLLLLANLQSMDETLRSLGIAPVMVIAGVVFLTVLTFVAGIGMWIGAKWGWWLGAFYYVYSITRNGTTLYTVYTMADQFDDGGRGPEYYAVKHGIRIVIHFLLFLYFFKSNVLEFFGMEEFGKAKAVSILVGACLAIAGGITGINWLLN